jgi:RNA polymerase sigma-70 factor (ECF subfamily)
MGDESDPTPDLLARWHGGDAAALQELVQRHLPWLRAYVDRRLGAFLRARADADDYLHDAIADFLRDAPRFQVRDGAQFRALLARIAENTLRDRNDWFRARRRRLATAATQVAVASDSVLVLDPALQRQTTPSKVASASEVRDWVRLGLELLEPEDRKVLIAREYDDRSFVDIGEELGMTPNAVRMRWVRAVARLAEVMKNLQAGRLPPEVHA